MAEFCKQFNEKSETMYDKGTPLGVELSAFSDRTFKFEVRSPPTSYLIKKAAGIKEGPNHPSPEHAHAFITVRLLVPCACELWKKVSVLIS